jgi:peptide/nickel transport system substrate-binding protein
MQTTYRLRPGLTWHDGRPLTADDFVFTRRAEQARLDYGLTGTNAELRQMDEIRAPDPLTVTIRWKRPYVEAAAPQLIAVPRHLLEGPLDQADPDAFGNLPYWTTEYVGAGAFRLTAWERGSFIEGAAFDAYALGRPNIGSVRFVWNSDPSVAVTRVLAGDVDMVADGAVRLEQASILRDQWKTGVVLLSPTSLRYIQVQARQEFVNPRSLLDVRMRRAIYHAVDRRVLAEAMVEDPGMTADSFPPPTSPYYAAVNQAITKYPFDVRRADQLLMEGGIARAGDGVYAHPAEGRFRLEVRGVSGGQEEKDTTIVAAGLRDVGMDPSITLLPSSARAVDDKTKGTFPSLTLNNNTLARRDLGLDKFISSRIGGPHDNWVGGNRMGWSHIEFDELFDLWTASLDRADATRRLVQMMRILSDELPGMPLYYNFQVVAHTSALRGPQAISPETTRYGNVHEWAWQ